MTYGAKFDVFTGRRKSNCVKEVEKIKQRREERRAAQVAIREVNETEYDTSQPNWEFGAMIKYVLYLLFSTLWAIAHCWQLQSYRLLV